MTRTGSKLVSDDEVFGSEEVDFKSSEANLKTHSPLSFLAPTMFKKDANGDESDVVGTRFGFKIKSAI